MSAWRIFFLILPLSFTLMALADDDLDYNFQSGKRFIYDNIPAPKGCPIKVHEIPGMIETYGTSANNNNKDEDLFLNYAQEYFEKAAANGPECESWAYSLRAFSALFTTLKSHAGTSSYELAREVGQEHYKYALFHMAFELFKNGRVKWLTEKFRKELGGGWTAKRNGKYKILGGYDCGKSAIFIDPTLRPFDLGAVMIHELDHFFRDKLVNFKDTSLPLVPYLILDEALASMHAGFIQRSLEYHPLWARRENLPGKKLVTGFGQKPEFQFQKDRQMYAKGGYLEKLWKALEYLGWNTFGPFHYDFFLAKSFLRKDSEGYSQLEEFYRQERLKYAAQYPEAEVSTGDSLASGELNPDLVNQATAEILQLVGRHYFRRSLTPAELTELSPTRLSLGLSPLSNWASANKLWLSKFGHPILDNRGYFSRDGRTTLADHHTNFTAIRESVKALSGQFDKVSPSCEAFQKSVAAGELDEYLGVRISRKNKPHRVKQLEGSEGNKPSSGEIQPGSEGNKPGTIIRPCLHTDDPP